MSSTHDLLEKIPALVAYIDASGVYRRMSHAYERWCGIRREEWLGRHYSEVAPGLFGEAYTREVLPRLERAFAGEAVNFEGRPLIGEAQGQVAVSYTPDFDEYGKVAGVLVLVTDLVPLKEAENRAMLSEERLRLAAEFSNMGMWEWDVASDRLAWNAAASRVMGWGGGEAPPNAEDVQERIHPDDRAERSATLERARQTRTPFRLEYRIRNQEGGWNWVHSRGCFLPDEQEEPARAVGVCFDITREKLATEQLVKQNQMIDSILESTTDGVIMVDFEFRFTYFNSRAMAVLGVNEALLGCSVWESFPQARDTRFGDAYRRTIHERRPVHFEEYYPEPLNRWFEVHAYPVESGLAAFFRDITEEREGREQLRLREQAIAAVPVGISVAEFSAEKDYPLVYVNPTFERLTGYSLDEIQGKNCRFLQGPETSPELRTQIRAAVAAGEPAKFVVRNYRKDGTDFLNELQISPVRNEVGEITHLVGIQNDVTELWTARGRLIQQAHFDPLTELPNRFYFMDTLKQVLRGARREQDSETALVYVDVDNLKHFNEQLGHGGGDRLLKKVATRIRSSVRDSDFVARLGGDEFAILVRDCSDRRSLEGLVERLLAKVSAPLRLNGRELMVTVSAGYACAPTDATEAGDLLRRADAAMYNAKRECRNSWKAYGPSMELSNHEFLEIAAGLREALKRRQFVLAYQPRIDALSGKMRAMEALIRWNHPERGTIAPGSFIRIAEETGLILPIGQWVVEEAARQLQAWRAAGFSPVPVSVNVSAVQFRGGGFCASVVKALREAEIPGDLLEIEITESMLMDEIVSSKTLAALREHGIRIAIDDFGTAYSGLSYLQRFPVDVLKIDRAFTRAIHQCPTAGAICQSIVQLAQKLRLTTVAEGVESAEQAELLRSWGCDELQGYHFGYPMPAESVQPMMAMLEKLA